MQRNGGFPDLIANSWYRQCCEYPEDRRCKH